MPVLFLSCIDLQKPEIPESVYGRFKELKMEFNSFFNPK